MLVHVCEWRGACFRLTFGFVEGFKQTVVLFRRRRDVSATQPMSSTSDLRDFAIEGRKVHARNIYIFVLSDLCPCPTKTLL